MQASEAALRQVGLHESAADFERLLRRFLRERRGRLQGQQLGIAGAPAAMQAVPRRRGTQVLPRRIPGLHMTARGRQE